MWGPYAACTRRRSDRAGKTRSALLEMRTAQSMRVNEKKETILLFQDFVVFKISDKSKHSKNEFYYPGEMQNYFSRHELTPKAKKESQHPSRMMKFTIFEANSKQTSCQKNNFSG